MSFDSDYNEIIIILHLQETRLQQDFKIIREILDRMRKDYHQRVQLVSDNSNGTRPENWKR